jgi:hypothetical protein
MAEQQKATKWTASQRRFINWVALPKEYRDHRTEVDYAKAAGVNRATLWKWKKLPGFWAEVQEATQQYLADTVPEGLEALKEMVRRGSFQHQKMYFEMLGMYVPKIAPTTPDGKRPYASTPTDDLFREIEDILDRGRARAARRSEE